MEASEIIERFGTRDPYRIAKAAGVIVTLEPLGEIRAYYNQAAGQKFIHINDELDAMLQKFAIEHCLYHAFTGKEKVTMWKYREEYVYSQHEIEANIFALELAMDIGKLMAADTFLEFCTNFGLSDDLYRATVRKLKEMFEAVTREPFTPGEAEVKPQLLRLMNLFTGNHYTMKEGTQIE